MAEKQTAAMKRLLKKLSALRKTLRKDERELLDHLVIRESEVKGHAFMADAGADAGADFGADAGVNAEADASADVNQDWDISLQNDRYNL
jgi:hypothetical protein